MNKAEKIIYDLVKKNPKMKNRIRDIYQSLLYYGSPKKKLETNYQVTTQKGYFFGFHDKIPFSMDDRRLLVHKIDSDLENKEKKHRKTPISLGYLYGDNFDKFQEIHRTKAWNYQQGSMLQWLGSTDHIIFNDFDEETQHYRGIIMDTKGNLVKRTNSPVGAVSPSGAHAVNYNFERLRVGMPGYGYVHGKDPDYEALIPKEGLRIIDIQSNKERELLKIQDLIDFKPEESMEGAFHFFTHCQFSPSGSRLLFFHRWFRGSERLHTRMYAVNLDGSELHLFPTTGMVSHVGWINDSEIIGYAETMQGDGYYIFRDHSKDFKSIHDPELDCDGHPQVSPTGEVFVTDTYPNRSRIQRLMLHDFNKRETEILGKFRSPLEYKDELRCDLHPRWNRKGDKICFDSTYTGSRGISLLDLKKKDES